MTAVGSRIKALHISDNGGVNEAHCMPGKGIIDWRQVIKAIKDINYTGTLNFETHVKTVEEIKETAVVGNTIFKGLM